MKKFKLLLILLGLGFLIWFQSCKGKNEPTTKDLQAQTIATSCVFGDSGMVPLKNSEGTFPSIISGEYVFMLLKQ